jgi:N-acetylmuramoyl-L-alanine amidase
VQTFQRRRGLRDDGVCDEATWSALVEASYALGDRVLYHRSPNLRGDDVAEIQARLGRLGFDAGRVDGIFGPLTAQALEEFQRNVGLRPDGICGHETLQALHRLGDRSGGGPSIAAVREQEWLRHSPRTLAGRRIVVGQLGSLSTLARNVSRRLRGSGAVVIDADEPDQSAHAAAANRFGADLYVGLGTTETTTVLAYYATEGFESTGGRHLATLLLKGIGPVLAEARVQGMRLPVLRETRMPAVLCELGPVADVVAAAPRLASAITKAVTCWVETPPV